MYDIVVGNICLSFLVFGREIFECKFLLIFIIEILFVIEDNLGIFSSEGRNGEGERIYLWISLMGIDSLIEYVNFFDKLVFLRVMVIYIFNIVFWSFIYLYVCCLWYFLFVC